MESTIVNHIIIVAKRMIASKYPLSTEMLLSILKKDTQMERFIAVKNGEMSNYDNKWAKLEANLVGCDPLAIGYLTVHPHIYISICAGTNISANDSLESLATHQC